MKKCKYGCKCDNGKKTLKKVMKKRGYVTNVELPFLANHENTRLIPLLIRTHSGRLISCAQDAERLIKELDENWWVRDVSIAGKMYNGISYIENISMMAP